jgi:RNA polymerase sigma-70 factor (ECF subfamily)
MHGILNFFSRSRETRQLLEMQRARLYRIAYAWTHQPALADDLVQETLTKAMQKSGQLRDPAASGAWLYTILANCYRDHFRRQRESEDIDELDLAHDWTPEQANSQQEVVQQVRLAIARLPEGQRQVVTLVDLEGFSYVEAAEILDVPIGTIMSRLCRARQALKELLSLLRQSESSAGETAPGSHLRRVK